MWNMKEATRFLLEVRCALHVRKRRAGTSGGQLVPAGRCYLERLGLLEGDDEHSCLASDAVDEEPLAPFRHFAHHCWVGQVAGFSLIPARLPGSMKGRGWNDYAGISAARRCPLSLTPNGNLRYPLKMLYPDGTTHVIFELLDFIARLAALVLRLRVNPTGFHDVFAPNSAYHARVTSAKQGRGNKRHSDRERGERTPAEPR